MFYICLYFSVFSFTLSREICFSLQESTPLQGGGDKKERKKGLSWKGREGKAAPEGMENKALQDHVNIALFIPCVVAFVCTGGGRRRKMRHTQHACLFLCIFALWLNFIYVHVYVYNNTPSFALSSFQIW